jgi:hypothetical protein
MAFLLGTQLAQSKPRAFPSLRQSCRAKSLAYILLAMLGLCGECYRNVLISAHDPIEEGL